MPKLRGYVAPSPLRLLEHVLENAALVRAVRELPPTALGTLIDAVGLEDSAELVALATTSQLEHVFDEDLWRAERGGEDPRFDPTRFGVWLQVLLEAGEKTVVDRLTELPVDFVIFAVSRLVLVVDMDQLGVELSDDEETLELTEKALDSTLAEEWEEFRLLSRDDRSFDAVTTALFALDRDHHDLLRRILERAAAASSEFIADNGGLYEVLSAEEMLESDARAERDDRRAARGYVAPSDARAFLAIARNGIDEDAPRDRVTRAYYRELGEHPADGARPSRAAPPPSRRADTAALLRLIDRAKAASGESESAPAPAGALAPATDGPLLKLALAKLGELDPRAHAERAEELAYLTNVVVAGDATLDGRSYRPIEALERALLLADVGLDAALAGTGRRSLAPQGSLADRAERAAELLRTTHLDRLFRLGLRRRET